VTKFARVGKPGAGPLAKPYIVVKEQGKNVTKINCCNTFATQKGTKKGVQVLLAPD